MDFKGKTAVITGASSGIGLAYSLEFAKRETNLVLVARSEAALKKLAADIREQHGVNVEVISQDLATISAGRELMGKLADLNISPDILVNNAGITDGNGPTWQLEPEVWRKVVDVNLVAPFLTCRAVVPHMISNGWGRIVNIASIATKFPLELRILSGAPRAALIRWTCGRSSAMRRASIRFSLSALRGVWMMRALGNAALIKPRQRKLWGILSTTRAASGASLSSSRR